MPTLSTSIFVTFDFVGFHCWPDAPEEVGYLRSRHRHLFKVRAEVSVEHSNRAIEYHTLKRELQTDAHEVEFGSLSCELIALRILQGTVERHPGRPYYRIEVSEDGENGSIIEARP